VLVPKAAVDENYLTAARENQVWPSGKITAVKSKTKSKAMRDLPHNHFWLCVG
jgi:hypothetical protein